jgi:hypothetical protein
MVMQNNLVVCFGVSCPTELPSKPDEEFWRWLPSGLLRRVVWWKLTDVSEVLAVSIIKETKKPIPGSLADFN